MEKPTLHRKGYRNCRQGVYKLVNPHKYVGDPSKVIYRSNLEHRFLKFFDLEDNVVNFASEEFVIPYFSKIDRRVRRYFPDFAIRVKQRDGSLKTIIIEIKPDSQTKPPKKPKNNTKRYIKEMQMYQKNLDKWEAATQFCESKGLTFVILTEKHLKSARNADGF